MKKVFLDANFLIDIVRFKVSLDEIKSLVGPNELIMRTSVIKELEKIANSKKTEGSYGKVALKLSKKFGVEQSTKANADEDLLTAGENVIVATNDRELRNNLKRRGVKTIYLRARKKLEIS